jgi:hypothetical protein
MQSETDFPHGLTSVEHTSLDLAKENGWLTLTPEIGDQAIALWQHDCERLGRPLAMLRLEPRRASLWFWLTPGREFTREEQARVHEALAGSTGFIVTSDNVRAFAVLGAEQEVMRKLLEAVEPRN